MLVSMIVWCIYEAFTRFFKREEKNEAFTSFTYLYAVLRDAYVFTIWSADFNFLAFMDYIFPSTIFK